MSSVYFLTLRQLSGKWRLAIMLVLAALPVVIATIMLNTGRAPTVTNFEDSILGVMLAGTIAPLIVLATASAAFGNEVEDRTLANLTLSPTPRWKIVMPKMLAVLSVAAPFIVLSAGLTSYIAFIADWQATIAVTVAAILGLVMYAAVFLWLGLVSTQAIGIGLLYIVLWEGFFTGYVTGVRLFSIRYYTMALMRAMDVRRFAAGLEISTKAVAVLAVVVTVAFLALAVRKLSRMDVP
jgi:ABC-2 type transport system permease protein